MKSTPNRDKSISRRFLILGAIVLILAVLILLTSRNDDNRIFNVETVYDTVFVATDSLSTTDSVKVIAHRRTAIPKNPWRGASKPSQNETQRKHPLHSNPENNKAFAQSISTLFSPYYYTSLTADDNVDLLYETCRNDSTYTFGVLCRWFSSCPDDGVEWCSPDSIAQYSTSSQYPTFLILGIGGSPDSPDTMYVLRTWTLRSSLTPTFLSKAHRKTPGKKFYYKPDGPWLN